MAEDIKFEIGAKDTASATVDKMVADVVAQQKKLTAAFKAAGVEVEKFDGKLKDTASGDTKNLAERVGLKDLNRSFKAANKHASELHRSISSFVPAFAALSAAATAAGIGHMFNGWTGAAAQLDRTALSMGVSVNRLDQTQTALRLTGGSAEAATAGLQGLQQAMRGALYGGDAQSAALFKGLGIDIGSFDKGARRALDVIPQIADAVKRVYRPGNPDAALNVLSRFGLGPEWLTVLKDGSAGWERYMEAAGKAGTITQQQADAAKALQQEQERLNIALEHFGYQIAGEIGPEITPVIADMARWVEANKDWLSHDITEAVKSFIGEVKKVHLQETIDNLKSMGERIDGLVQSFGGWKVAIEGILGLKLLGWVTSLLGPLGTMIRLLALIPGSGVAAGAAAVGAGGYLGWKGAVKNGTDIGHAAELGMRPSSLPGSVDEFGNVTLYQGPDGKIYTPDEVETMYRLKHPVGGSSQQGQNFDGDALGQGVGRTYTKGVSPAVSQNIPPQARALLDAIAIGESGGDYSKVNPTSGTFGRYQFTAGTWSDMAKKTGQYARTPEAQDQNAWELAQQRYRINSGGRDLLTDLQAGRDPSPFLNRTWTSLPGGAEPNMSTMSFGDRLRMNLNRPGSGRPGGSPPAPASVAPDPSQSNYSTDDSDHFGRIRVEVIHQILRPGASLQVTTPDGSNITVDKPLVMQSMPNAGSPRNIARDGY